MCLREREWALLCVPSAFVLRVSMGEEVVGQSANVCVYHVRAVTPALGQADTY